MPPPSNRERRSSKRQAAAIAKTPKTPSPSKRPRPKRESATKKPKKTDDAKKEAPPSPTKPMIPPPSFSELKRINKLYSDTIGNPNRLEASEVLSEMEESGLIERVLWPLCYRGFHLSNKEFTSKHAILMALLTNGRIKHSTGGSPFGYVSEEYGFETKADDTEEGRGPFSLFFSLVLSHATPNDELWLLTEKIKFVHLASTCMDISGISREVLQLTSGIWDASSDAPDGTMVVLSERRRELECFKYPALRSLPPSPKPSLFLPLILHKFLSLLSFERHDPHELEFVYQTVSLLTELLSQLPTRRFLSVLLEDANISAHCQMSPLFTSPLFFKLYTAYEHYQTHAVDAMTGKTYDAIQSEELAEQKMHALRTLCFKYHREDMKDFCLSSIPTGTVKSEQFLRTELGRLPLDHLWTLAWRLRLVRPQSDADRELPEQEQREFVLKVLIRAHCPRAHDDVSSMPVYPTETTLEDARQTSVSSLPKLNLQFLSFNDYLHRMFTLSRLESAHSVRDDLLRTVKRIHPTVTRDEVTGEMRTTFRGWARMGLELKDNSGLTIRKVGKPKLGENVPSQVIGQICVDLKPLGVQFRREWEQALQEYENFFLIRMDAEKAVAGGEEDEEEEDVSQYGVVNVRGCMVLEVRDEKGTLLNDRSTDHDPSQITTPSGNKRFVTVALDAAQYFQDVAEHGEDHLRDTIYRSFNFILRRQARENNFKSCLETVRSLLTDFSNDKSGVRQNLPPWLQSVLLGYGDPKQACYDSKTLRTYADQTAGVNHPDDQLDYGDSFLSQTHLKHSFPDWDVQVKEGATDKTPTTHIKQQNDRKNYKIMLNRPSKTLTATWYHPPLSQTTKGNKIQFTPAQISAVRSGLSPGLTLLVGPPGTGKTDVATQIIANLFHSFKTQRTLLITHSNAALNDLFKKLIARGDIPQRYMLRLGRGERDLQAEGIGDFTKLGRVRFLLEERKELLEKVQKLSESLGVSSGLERDGITGEGAYTCETAKYFELHHVVRRMQIFESNVASKGLVPSDDIIALFPFRAYFGLDEKNNEEDKQSTLTLEQARWKYASLLQIFSELEEYRPLELLRSSRQRADYLLTKQAKIVAMTCTHAAIARAHLIDVGFQYDNVVMEEAGQMLEVETFIPLLLQKHAHVKSPSQKKRGGPPAQKNVGCRLKRIVLIGDPNQLPPIVKNRTFSNYSKLDQSMFSRMIRLGVPTIMLDKQGRCRPEIARLFSWRYNGLGDLDHVMENDHYKTANAGFRHTFQMINVEDFEGRGESTPTAYFYQNLGEAEYTIATFQFMVLIGYPPSSISILTTYNGQKELLNDILSQRCGPGTPLANIRPKTISTVDQYQGQQNDYILLSFVRTKNLGYLRDVRRLVVAVSRARFGLYVFCRRGLLEGCHELRETIRQFSQGGRGDKLCLVKKEGFPVTRKAGEEGDDGCYQVEDVKEMGVLVHKMQEDYVGENGGGR